MKYAFLFLGLVACGSDQTTPQPTPPLVLEAGTPAPATPRRMASHRNPFGDALQADNLMLDGDFELTGRSDQAPWIAVENQGQVTMDYDTGGHCRSGVRCASLADPQVLVGYMATPMAANLHVRAYAKPSSGKCSDVQVLGFDFAQGTASGTVSATTKTPGPDGWCVYESDIDGTPLGAPGLYFQVAAKTSALIDDVTALPVGEAPVHGIKLPPAEIDATTRARLATTAAWLRAHRKYGR